LRNQTVGSELQRNAALLLGAGLLAICLAVAIAAVILSSGRPVSALPVGPPSLEPSKRPAQFTIRAATAKQLFQNGLVLGDPGSAVPLIKRTAAQDAAERAFGDVVGVHAPLQVVLTTVTYEGNKALQGKLCWMVDLTPAGGLPLPGGSGGSHIAAWFLVFVDARTEVIDLAVAGT